MRLVYLLSKLIKKAQLSSVRQSTIHKTSKVEAGCNIVNVDMAKHSFCGYNCEIYNTDIGAFTSIANNVVIGGGMHPVNWVSTSPVFYSGRDSVKAKFSYYDREQPLRTIIGHDVWIGQNVLIKQGVKIGIGAVIGMGCIVTKDVSPYSIVVGNPQRVIKYRFDENIIKRLIASQWWKLEDKKLLTYATHVKNVELFLKQIERNN